MIRATSLVRWLLASSLCPVLSTLALADTRMTVADTPVVVGVGGFIHADYDTGDRFSNLVGKDVLGISNAALAITPTTEGIKGVFVIGTTALTDGNINPDHNGQVGIKDAYIIVGYNKEVGFSFSAGAQPLLFGLKPNGYPGDSSLQGNIDYDAAGG